MTGKKEEGSFTLEVRIAHKWVVVAAIPLDCDYDAGLVAGGELQETALIYDMACMSFDPRGPRCADCGRSWSESKDDSCRTVTAKIGAPSFLPN